MFSFGLGGNNMTSEWHQAHSQEGAIGCIVRAWDLQNVKDKYVVQRLPRRQDQAADPGGRGGGAVALGGEGRPANNSGLTGCKIFAVS